jgi:hypothetical protein
VWLIYDILLALAARPCPAASPAQSPAAGAPVAPRSGATLDLRTAQLGNEALYSIPLL